MEPLRNVLIVTQSFPPHNNIAARRFGYLTPHLESVGWRPWILTMESDGPLPVRLSPEQILRIGRHPESPTSSPSSGTGVSPVMQSPHGQDARATQNEVCHKITGRPVRRGLSTGGEGLRRVLALGRLRFRAIDYTCLTWRREVLRQENTLLAKLPSIDLVLGTFGPAAALWLARHFARVLRVPWVADFRDLAALRPDERGQLAQWLDRRIERTLLRSASGLTTVSPTLRRILRRTYRRPTRAIYNGWDTTLPSPSGRGAGGECTPPSECSSPYLHYAGRFYPERLEGAIQILDMLSKCSDLSWTIRSLGPTNLEDQILTEARRRNVADRVQLLPPAPPEMIQAEAAGALANVVLDDVRPGPEWAKGTLTGKFLELVALRPPVLAITRADSDMGPILRRTAKGRVCSTTKEIVRFIDAIRNGAETFEGTPEQIERFSKQRQAAVLAKFFDTLVAGTDSRGGQQ
ncbi:MAG: glycosyltransferase [Pirellulales bacterium]|nr:glycosyltransferase [Pirellulales bacterium]